MTNTSTQPASSSSYEYLSHRIDKAKKDYAKAIASMIDDITKCGPTYAWKWAKDKMQAEYDHQVALEIEEALAKGTTLAELVEDMNNRVIDRAGYLIPSNSDVDADVFRLQATCNCLRDLKAELKWEQKEQAKAA